MYSVSLSIRLISPNHKFISTISGVPSVFIDFDALYLRACWLERSDFIENLFDNVATHHVPNFQGSKTFCREGDGEKNSERR